MNTIASQPPGALPELPLYARHTAGCPSDIHAGDGRLLGMVSMPGNASPQPLADLFALAPDLLADLAGFLRALMLLDEAYRQEHFPDLSHADAKEALLDAASNAIATLSHAADLGLPVHMPGLDQLEDQL